MNSNISKNEKNPAQISGLITSILDPEKPTFSSYYRPKSQFNSDARFDLNKSQQNLLS